MTNTVATITIQGIIGALEMMETRTTPSLNKSLQPATYFKFTIQTFDLVAVAHLPKPIDKNVRYYSLGQDLASPRAVESERCLP